MVLWLLLGTFSMVAMLWTAAHKTVVISARSQEQGELVPEYRTEQTGEMQLPMQTDQKADRQICIPLESGTKAENVVVENHYMEKELWIYIENGRKAFYKERRITGDLNPVEKGICEAQNEGVLLRLSMREVLEYHSTLEEGSLWVDYVSPKELYDRIVVLDPVGGGRDPGVTASGCQEKEVALSVARQTAQLMEDRQVNILPVQRISMLRKRQEGSSPTGLEQICIWRSDCRQIRRIRRSMGSAENIMMNIIFRSSATFSGPIALQGRLRWRPAIGQWDFSRQQRKMSCGRSQSRQPESLWGM